MLPAHSRSQTIQDLKQHLRQAVLVESRERILTGVPMLDGLFPGGGLERGSLVEWLAESEGSGAGTLALLACARMAQAGGRLVVIDPRGEFYPPAAVTLGLRLDELIVVRPSTPADALWAFEQTLRCAGVSVVLGWLGQEHNRGLRRLQLAAEAGGTLGFLIRPAAVRSLPSWAEARLLVRTLPSQSPGWRLRVELIRCRNGTGGGTVDMDIAHDETGLVRPAAPLASAADPGRASGTE